MAQQTDKRLLWETVDLNAERTPERLFCVHPVSSQVADGWRDVTARDFAAGVNYLASWIEENIGLGTGSSTLGYLAVNDIRYIAFVLACIKTRHKAFFPAPTLSEQGLLHLFSSTKCSKLVHSKEREAQVQKLQKAGAITQTWIAPALWDAFGRELTAYTTKSAHDNTENEIVLFSHSSGTTGFPKPIAIRHGYITAFNNLQLLDSVQGFVVNGEKRRLLRDPFCHMSAHLVFYRAVFQCIPFVLVPDVPLTGRLLAQIVSKTKPDSTFFAPAILEELWATENGREALSSIPYIVYGAAPLNSQVGNAISKVTRLQVAYGSTECGGIPQLWRDVREDWEYHEWHPKSGVKMQHVADNTYQLILTRGSDRSLHCVFHTFPELEEYETRDLFVPHPTTANLWRYYGRLDDVIVLSTGAKFNPIPLEKTIESHHFVSRVVILGQGKRHPYLLVQPAWNKLGEWDGRKGSLVDEIWPAVHIANELAPSHRQLTKNRTLVIPMDRPFKMTPKGSIQRQLVHDDYAEDIDKIECGLIGKVGSEPFNGTSPKNRHPYS